MSSLLTGLISYYEMEGNGNDSLGVNNLTSSGVAFNTLYGRVLQGAEIIWGVSTMASTTAIGFPAGASPRTTTMWIQTVSPNVMVFLPYGTDTGTPNEDWAWVFIGGQVVLGLGSGGAVFSPSVVNDGLWHFVVATYDGSIVNIYVDDVLVASQGEALNTIPTTLKVQAYQLDAYLDELGYWNRVLTPTELTTLYNGGAGLTYPFAPPLSTTNAGLLFNLL